MATLAYVYKWTHIPTLKWYIGSRTAKGCHPDDGYICSSKTVKPLILDNPNEWKREIIATGEPAEMFSLEMEILITLDAPNDIKSYNLAINGPVWNNKNDGTIKFKKWRERLVNANTGRLVSDRTRAKIGNANRGKKRAPITEETRLKKSEAQKRSYANGRVPAMKDKIVSSQTRLKLSQVHLGKKKSKNHRTNISKGKKGKSYGGNLKMIETPYGIFSSITKAGKHEEVITGKKFNPNRFTKLLKDPNSGYRIIKKLVK